MRQAGGKPALCCLILKMVNAEFLGIDQLYREKVYDTSLIGRKNSFIFSMRNVILSLRMVQHYETVLCASLNFCTVNIKNYLPP